MKIEIEKGPTVRELEAPAETLEKLADVILAKLGAELRAKNFAAVAVYGDALASIAKELNTPPGKFDFAVILGIGGRATLTADGLFISPPPKNPTVFVREKTAPGSAQAGET